MADIHGTLQLNHLYIDTCASYASTPCHNFLTAIHVVEWGLVGHSSCGPTTMTEQGCLGQVGDFWLNESGIANIIPPEQIAKIWRVTYNPAAGMNSGRFVIHTDQGNVTVHKNLKGMPYIDLDGVDGEITLTLSR